MAFDPFSTVLAIALCAPTFVNTSRPLRVNASPKHLDGELLTERTIFYGDVETDRLLAPVIQDSGDRVTSVIAEVRRYASFPDGWDGPRSVKPSNACVAASIEFMRVYPAGLPVPTPMITSSGEIGFYWNEAGGYADISFDSEGFGSFYGQNRDGVDTYDERLTIRSLSRDWFFEKVGEISAPQLLAA